MGKKSRRKQQRHVPASSDPAISPEATLGPEATLEATGARWKDTDSTNAPIVGEEEASDVYARSYPALLERLLQDKLPIRLRTVFMVLVVAWFGFVSWLFIQDNSSGALANWPGLRWFSAKVGFYSLFLVAAGVVLVLTIRWSRDSRPVG
jgi:hypothetical protein